MDKATVLSLLRGSTCERCHYLITGMARNSRGGSIDLPLGEGHCSLRTDVNGDVSEKSRIEDYKKHSCSSIWRRDELLPFRR